MYHLDLLIGCSIPTNCLFSLLESHLRAFPLKAKKIKLNKIHLLSNCCYSQQYHLFSPKKIFAMFAAMKISRNDEIRLYVHRIIRCSFINFTMSLSVLHLFNFTVNHSSVFTFFYFICDLNLSYSLFQRVLTFLRPYVSHVPCLA